MPDNQAWRILHIDDDADDYALVHIMLHQFQWRAVQLEWAPTYDEGLQKLTENTYDAVLIDYDLGTHTGIELIRHLAENSYEAPLILFTGRGSYEVDVEAMQAGATLYLTKGEATPLLLERSIRYAIERKHIEAQLRHSNQLLSESNRDLVQERNRLLAVMEALPVGVAIIDDQDVILQTNPAYERIWGRPNPPAQPVATDVVYKAWWMDTGQPLQYDDWASVRAVHDGVAVIGQYLKIERFDGTHATVINSAVPIRDASGTVTSSAIAIMDVSKQRQNEEQLRQLNRTLKAISNSNQALMRAKDEDAFLNEVCHIIVRDCGHSLVWVGFANHDDGKTVRPVAHFGFDPAYLESLHITWADEPRGRGPSGTAIRTGQVSIVQNILTDPKFEPWRAQAVQRGYAASVALPLIQDGQAFGVLNIYSTEPEAFSEEEVTLLRELASDLSFGLTAIRTRHAQAQAEENLRYLASFPERIPNPIIEADLDGNIIYMNPAAGEVMPDLPDQKTNHPWLAGWEGIAAAFQNGSTDSQSRDVSIGKRIYQQIITYLPENELIRIYASDITERSRAEQALRGSEERFRLALKNMPVVVANVDRGLRYTWIYNPLVGYNVDDVIGQMVGFSADAETAQISQTHLRTLFDTSQPIQWEHTSMTRAGEMTFQTYAEPIYGAAGEVIGAAYASINITERKRMENALKRSEALFSKAFRAGPNAISISRAGDERIVEVNPSYEKLFGYQLDEVRGKTTAELNYFEDPSNRMEAVRLLREQGSLHNYELEVRSRDGQLHTVMVSAEVIEMDGEDHFLTIFHDVTEGRRAERALHTQNARLLHYATELERSNQALEDFAIVAAHDLQEPLRKIKGFGDLLKSRMGVEISPEAQDYLDRIQQAAGRMQTMLDSLLAYSRVSTQNGQMQEVDLHTLVGEVLSDLEWRIEQTGAQVELGPLPILQADPTQMRQLFQNLLANALKFNQPEIAPVIKISSRPISATQFTISIEDNGVGFDEQQADDLFKPFHRLHPKARFEGNGMGLAICRKIVERHNGSISARSRPGQGSTFVVTLPLSPEY